MNEHVACGGFTEACNVFIAVTIFCSSNPGSDDDDDDNSVVACFVAFTIFPAFSGRCMQCIQHGDIFAATMGLMIMVL